tara:strand:+ start:731 stop:1198 length:468 start_codon:yes stop_codon:yes gene_type:complete
MKKISLICLALIASCNDVNIKNTDTVQKIKIDYYSSKETKELDFPFSDATIVNNIIYVAGQVGNLPGTNKVVEGGIRAETRQTMENIETVLTAVGSSLDKVFKCTCMLSDIGDWGIMSEEYKKFFDKEKKPSRSAFAGTGLALGAKIEIECWAIR